MKTAIVTGVTGQDGSYLAELLDSKCYRVYGIKRRNSSNSLGNAAHLANKIEIVEGDLLDLGNILSLCKLVRPNEFYNLAAMSHVGISFDTPVATLDINAKGPLNCLEAIRLSGIHTKFYQASTSELFGGMPGTAPQNEETPFHPRSPYGVSKLHAYWSTVNYRESYKMFACNGILFNHESERRSPNFVTRKITMAAAKISKGLQDKLYLGNLTAQRDWGYAPDYCEGMWKILQHNEPEDFVLATGTTHTVRDFCEAAFNAVGLDYRDYVVANTAQDMRPAEVDLLLGDPSKALRVLGWKAKTTFKELVEKMVKFDLETL